MLNPFFIFTDKIVWVNQDHQKIIHCRCYCSLFFVKDLHVHVPPSAASFFLSWTNRSSLVAILATSENKLLIIHIVSTWGMNLLQSLIPYLLQERRYGGFNSQRQINNFLRRHAVQTRNNTLRWTILRVWWGAKKSEWGLESGKEVQGLQMYCTRRNQLFITFENFKLNII